MNDRIHMDRDGAKRLLRWREAPQAGGRAPVEPGSYKVSAAVLSDPDVG